MIIFATLVLPKNLTRVNQVWEEGPVNGDQGSLGMHALSGDNIKSMGTVDFLSKQTVLMRQGKGDSRLWLKNFHGVISVVSWGTLTPMGAMIARNLNLLKPADPVAYVLGVAGWATGLFLGSKSHGIQFDAHRTIGIMLFCLGTLQVFALVLRPKKDHKYRTIWNIYHNAIGYTLIILSIINVYKGLDCKKTSLR
ncbi:Cytochrome b561 and DOMON domain-containing protein [Fagus crenata]